MDSPEGPFPDDGRLRHAPMSRDEANAFVGVVHRHSGPVVVHRFAIGLWKGRQLVGTAIVGNTKARVLHDRQAAEIVRVATDGTPNACSYLYGACRRIWAAMGGDPARLYTYTLVSETGASLRASGFVQEAVIRGKEWDTASRRRTRKGGAQAEDKVRWRAAP